jgi:Chlorophyllase enzyme
MTRSLAWLSRTLAAAVVLAAAVGLAATTASPAAAPPTQATLLPLPVPTGTAPVGTVSLRLVDPSRLDRLAPARANKARELMVQIWYPAASASGAVAGYVSPKLARLSERALGLAPGSFARIAHARQGVPVAPSAPRFPVVLFSTGFGVQRFLYTSLLEDLASHGFVVVAPDYTYETAVEFPGGRLTPVTVANSEKGVERALSVRIADTRFLLTRLVQLNRAGRFAGRLDLERIGMFGHSLGGATAASTMFVDRRIDAGADLDGSLHGRVVVRGLGQPFMLMMQPLAAQLDETQRQFWSHLKGSRPALVLAGADHYTFTDMAVLAPQLRATAPKIVHQAPTGTIDGVRAIAIERASVRAFFSAHLRGSEEPLLAQPAALYPELSSPWSPTG